MLKLILDVKICIASFDEDVWYWFYRYDNEFKNYAYTNAGRHMFIQMHHQKKNRRTYVCGYMHSINDQPSFVNHLGHYYHARGKNHRDNDLPAIILHDGTKHWFHQGMNHRDNDLPAIMYYDGRKEWYCHGKFIKKDL